MTGERVELLNVVEATENCRYCLMCRHTCPVGQATNLETLTPHGWGLLIASVERGLAVWNEETVHNLYQCADCGNCRAHCVTDQPLPDAIAAARATIVSQNLAPAIVYDLDNRLRQWGNPFVAESPAPVTDTGDVALFVGDDAHYLWPGAVAAAVQLLAAAGINPVLIGVGRNNGYLASSVGLKETAIMLAQTNMAELKATGAQRLLVLSPGDYDAFHRLYAERLGLAGPDVPVMELVTFLAERLRAGQLAFQASESPLPFAYLDPTHAGRVGNERHAYPRELLGAVYGRGRELFLRADRSLPCGSTALQFTSPQLSQQLTQTRLHDAYHNGIQSLITEDPGTLHQLSLYAAAYGIQVQGLYELLAAQLVS